MYYYSRTHGRHVLLIEKTKNNKKLYQEALWDTRLEEIWAFIGNASYNKHTDFLPCFPSAWDTASVSFAISLPQTLICMTGYFPGIGAIYSWRTYLSPRTCLSYHLVHIHCNLFLPTTYSWFTELHVWVT